MATRPAPRATRGNHTRRSIFSSFMKEIIRTSEMKPNHTLRRHLIILALYLVITLITTYPLIVQFGDHLMGSQTWAFDELFQTWNNWWFKFALFDRGISPFHTDWLFYPQGTNLILYAYTLLHVVLLQP